MKSLFRGSAERGCESFHAHIEKLDLNGRSLMGFGGLIRLLTISVVFGGGLADRCGQSVLQPHQQFLWLSSFCRCQLPSG